MTGTGGTGTHRNYGIFVFDETSVLANGDITFIGTGGEGTAEQNRGIFLTAGSIVESTGGAVTMTGTGGTGTEDLVGVVASNQTSVFANGDITFIGTGGDGTGAFNVGIDLRNGSIVESIGGAVA